MSLFGLIWAILAAAGSASAVPSPEPLPLPDLAARVEPSVVEVLGKIEGSGDSSYGTGFILHEPSLVVTNAHVVRGVSEPLVRTKEGALLASVKVLETDEKADLALLRVTGLRGQPLPLAPGGPPAVGTAVFAVGHPRGYEFTFSEGIVSAVRSLDPQGVELIQTTAPISPGSSGGPLLNAQGQVVGVCSLTLMEGQNINFAVPARLVLPFIERSLAVERALIQPPGSQDLPPESLARVVKRHREEGDLVRASDLVHRALATHPRSLALLAEAAEVAWSRGNAPEVHALLDRMNRESPNYPPARQIRSALLAQEGQCDAAVREARAALDGGLEPGQAAEAHAVLAECLGRMGQAEAALQEMDLALGSENIAVLPDYHALRAFLLQALGRTEEADREAVTALELSAWDPLVVAALRERGLPRLVEILSFNRTRVNGTFVVSGVVRNRGPVPVQDVQITAEGIDTAGHVLATGSATVTPQKLVPGQTGSFKIVLQGAADDPLRLEVRVVDFKE